MPVSKNGKLYYTKEQFERARYDANALEYARQQGYDLVRDGSRHYHLREHDSMIFTEDGRWYWNSHGLYGGALEFAVYYEGKTVPEAVNLLAPMQQSRAQLPDSGRAETPPPRAQTPAQTPAKPLALPDKARNPKQLYAYLCQTRKIDREVVHELVRQGRLYQANYTFTGKDGAEHQVSNAVFVSYAPDGTPSGAFQRGLSEYAAKPFKQELPGGSKDHAFLIPSKTPADTVAVFEAAIDAASHATIAAMELGTYSGNGVDRIALGGIIYTPLANYLKQHPDVKTVWLCLDNDAAGKNGVKWMREQLAKDGFTPEHGYAVADWLPTVGKDWNDQLVQMTRINEQIRQHAQQQSAESQLPAPECCMGE